MIIIDDTESYSLGKILTTVFRMSTFQAIQLINYVSLEGHYRNKITRDNLKTSVLDAGKLVLSFNSLRMALEPLEMFFFFVFASFFGESTNVYQLFYITHCYLQPLFLHTLVVSQEVISL